jgi:hypothetical protein
MMPSTSGGRPDGPGSSGYNLRKGRRGGEGRVSQGVMRVVGGGVTMMVTILVVAEMT